MRGAYDGDAHDGSGEGHDDALLRASLGALRGALDEGAGGRDERTRRAGETRALVLARLEARGAQRSERRGALRAGLVALGAALALALPGAWALSRALPASVASDGAVEPAERATPLRDRANTSEAARAPREGALRRARGALRRASARGGALARGASGASARDDLAGLRAGAEPAALGASSGAGPDGPPSDEAGPPGPTPASAAQAPLLEAARVEPAASANASEPLEARGEPSLEPRVGGPLARALGASDERPAPASYLRAVDLVRRLRDDEARPLLERVARGEGVTAARWRDEAARLLRLLHARRALDDAARPLR